MKSSSAGRPVKVGSRLTKQFPVAVRHREFVFTEGQAECIAMELKNCKVATISQFICSFAKKLGDVFSECISSLYLTTIRLCLNFILV